MQDCV